MIAPVGRFCTQILGSLKRNNRSHMYDVIPLTFAIQTPLYSLNPGIHPMEWEVVETIAAWSRLSTVLQVVFRVGIPRASRLRGLGQHRSHDDLMSFLQSFIFRRKLGLVARLCARSTVVLSAAPADGLCRYPKLRSLSC